MLHHSVAMLDSPAKRERDAIVKKKTNKTEPDNARLEELDMLLSFWCKEDGEGQVVPTVPTSAIRGQCVEADPQGHGRQAGPSDLSQRGLRVGLRAGDTVEKACAE